jgi:hypothetical protein
VAALSTGIVVGLLIFTLHPPRAVASHIAPVEINSNASCQLTGLTQFHREENPDDGSALVVIGEVTYTVFWDVHADNTVDWRTTNGLVVLAVFVKGGSGGGGNLYDYRSIGGETADSGLHALVNPSGKFAGLSHISFCGDFGMPTTTDSSTSSSKATSTSLDATSTMGPTTEAPSTTLETTTSSTSTTTVVATTISTSTTTTTIASTTSTSQATTSTTTEDEVLAFTGPEDEGLGLIAMALAALGAMLLVGERSLSYSPSGRSLVLKRCRKCEHDAVFKTPLGGMCLRHTRHALDEDDTLWMPRRLK